jgi:hypothetical protein
VDFVVRSGLNVTVTRDAQWRPLAEHTVTAFTDALNRSPLNAHSCGSLSAARLRAR